MATKRRLVRFTILVKRNPALSEEEFHSYWTTKHVPQVQDWLTRHGIMKYTQYHTPSSVRDQAKSIPGLAQATIAEWDGFVELLMPNMSCFDEAQKDPYYSEVVFPDELKFADPANSQIIIGWEEVYVQDGKIVDLQPGGNVVTA
ncbi:hypothetical protein PV05_04790 [Exophiala xenobiotica]|uniref:EthD domain-containing protein n=1 Tax=Exophiala xenobiotica TaxID=348802 RepID=A0A0D2D138_9EURO|nr:uncharacterized protein PV05_04790 [Exophiala xenobiotica]KIW56107.1 hypothetical protein PV05_04790 [Exophiala xenobiotica]